MWHAMALAGSKNPHRFASVEVLTTTAIPVRMVTNFAAIPVRMVTNFATFTVGGGVVLYTRA